MFAGICLVAVGSHGCGEGTAKAAVDLRIRRLRRCTREPLAGDSRW